MMHLHKKELMQLHHKIGRAVDVVLIGSLPPPSGGVASHLADLVRAVEGEGARATIVALPGPGRSRAAAAVEIASALVMMQLHKKLMHLHTNGHNDGSWRLAAAIGAAAGRAVLTLHSGLAPAHIARDPRRCARVARRFRGIVCVSEAIAGALAQAGVPRERMVIAPAFSSETLPLPLLPAGLSAIARRARPLIAATIARGAEYGARSLVDGFGALASSLPDAHLVVYGPAARGGEFDALAQKSP